MIIEAWLKAWLAKEALAAVEANMEATEEAGNSKSEPAYARR